MVCGQTLRQVVAQLLELELLRPRQFLSIFLMVIATLPILVVSIIFTALTDKLCCCCCNPREQLSVYHLNLDKRFILVNGEVVEDVETPREDIVKLDICIIHLLKWSKVSHDRVAGLGGDSTHVLSPGQFNISILSPGFSPAVLYQPIILIVLPPVANHKNFVV